MKTYQVLHIHNFHINTVNDKNQMHCWAIPNPHAHESRKEQGGRAW